MKEKERSCRICGREVNSMKHLMKLQAQNEDKTDTQRNLRQEGCYQK